MPSLDQVVEPVALLMMPIGVTAPLKAANAEDEGYKKFIAELYENDEMKISKRLYVVANALTSAAEKFDNNLLREDLDGHSIDTRLIDYCKDIAKREEELENLKNAPVDANPATAEKDLERIKREEEELVATLHQFEEFLFLVERNTGDETIKAKKGVALASLFHDMSDKKCRPGMYAKIVVAKNQLLQQDLREELAGIRQNILEVFATRKENVDGGYGYEVHNVTNLATWANNQTVSYDLPLAAAMEKHGDVYARAPRPEITKRFEEYFSKKYTVKNIVPLLVASCLEHMQGDIDTIGLLRAKNDAELKNLAIFLNKHGFPVSEKSSTKEIVNFCTSHLLSLSNQNKELHSKIENLLNTIYDEQVVIVSDLQPKEEGKICLVFNKDETVTVYFSNDEGKHEITVDQSFLPKKTESNREYTIQEISDFLNDTMNAIPYQINQAAIDYYITTQLMQDGLLATASNPSTKANFFSFPGIKKANATSLEIINYGTHLQIYSVDPNGKIRSLKPEDKELLEQSITALQENHNNIFDKKLIGGTILELYKIDISLANKFSNMFPNHQLDICINAINGGTSFEDFKLLTEYFLKAKPDYFNKAIQTLQLQKQMVPTENIVFLIKKGFNYAQLPKHKVDASIVDELLNSYINDNNKEKVLETVFELINSNL